MAKLTEKSLIKIYNNTLGSASLIVDGKRFYFPKYNTYKTFKLSEIQDIYNNYPRSIESGAFIFYDKEVYDSLGIDESIVKKILTKEQIEALLSKDADEIVEELTDASDIIKENVARVAKEKDIDSNKKKRAIKKATGFEVENEDIES